MIFELPVNADGDRTFSCALGANTYFFRTYFTGTTWLMDVLDSEYQPLALGRKIILGSINIFKGFANSLSSLACIPYQAEGISNIDEALGSSLRIMWFTSQSENPLSDGDPMDALYENFYIAQ